MNFFENSVFFGVTISLIAYGFGHALQGKFKLAILNPLLISVASIIALLVPELSAHACNRLSGNSIV